MITVKGFAFPETAEEKWQPMVRIAALQMQVLCVACTRVERAWSAYCLPVPGMDHDYESKEVLKTGAKLPEHIARAIFPMFDGLPYAK